VHPPDFSIHHRLSDWPDCRIEVNCSPCGGRRVDIPVRLLLRDGPDRPFASIVAGLRCKVCGGKPAPVYLVAGLTRSFCFGPPPSWAVELVPACHAGPSDLSSGAR
jgi:hypothetical protein